MCTYSEDHTNNIMKRKRIVSHEDHITDLPEGVIGHILSYLPTKDAVRTSILSRSWEHKWTSICNISVDDECKSLVGYNRKSTFLKYVSKIINSTKNSRINSFRLKCKLKYDPHHLSTWISAVLSRKVQSLEIEASKLENIVFPGGLSSCTSLIKLRLFVSCRLEVSATCSFLYLKSLYIGGGRPQPTEILNVSNSGQLILDFPVLETFEINHCKWVNVKFVEIKAPELIKFKTQSMTQLINDCVIKIFGPKLVEFHTYGFKLMDNFVLCSPLLCYAILDHIEMSDLLGLRASMLLNGIPSLKRLKLSPQVVMALAQTKSRHALRTFDIMEILEFNVGCGIEWLDFLHMVPSLESLQISVAFHEDYNYDYGNLESLPRCFFHLKEVKLVDFVGERHQVELAKFILKNASKLVKMFIYFDECKLSSIRSTLLALPKSSSCASLVIAPLSQFYASRRHGHQKYAASLT